LFFVKKSVVLLIAVVCLLSSLFAQSNSPASRQIRWDRQTFSIGNKDVILIGGSMHYFRIPQEEWAATFERMREDGFNIVDIYIPWFIHEPEENKFDFDNLQHFLDMAHKYGLYVVARPGPYINSETDQGAFPRWLSGKDVGFRRNTELDRKWSKHWYDAIMPLLARNQITHGGPVIMVQIENEYGHPQYVPVEEKKEFVRFLYQITAVYGFDVPLMGNDMQFAQDDLNDPVLSKIYGTVDAYFGSYQELEQMLTKQRQLNIDTPLGCAEYGLDGAEATVRTMLGLGTDYLDEYLFRGGSQFAHAAKGYEFAGYSADAIVEEGGYTLPKYRAMKTNALFLRQFGDTVARAAPAPEPATVDDPEVWIRQRNKGDQGFLFVRSDMRGVSDLTLALKSMSAQHITYHDPKSAKARVIPRYSTLLLRREQTRLMVLNLPVKDQTTLVYSTADLFGKYAYPDCTWLVFYGNPGEESEAAFSFASKPADLSPDAVWDQDNREAVFRLQFGEVDQIIPVTKDVSLLVLSRERAYRAKELPVGGNPALLVSGADDAVFDATGHDVTLHLELRQPIGQFTILAGQELTSAKQGDQVLPITRASGTQQFKANIPVPSLSREDGDIRVTSSWTGFAPTLSKTLSPLASLPEAGILKKGVTHYHATFPGRASALRLRFFTDDYKLVYMNGQFVPEATNRAKEAILRSQYCANQKTCTADIYYVDTGRPKEDLGLWRLDEKKGLQAADWLDGTSESPLNTEWQAQFSGLADIAKTSEGKVGLPVLAYSFPRPSSGGLEAVWRVFMPDVPGLVYLNGVYVEHHEPGREPNIGRPGIYLPPSLLKEDNKLLFVALEPLPSNLPLPVIRAEADSVRKSVTVVLQFAANAGVR
jgi:hypothetical protein